MKKDKRPAQKRLYLVIAALLAIVILLYFKVCGSLQKPLDDGSMPSAAILALASDHVGVDRIEFTLDFIVFRDSENVETQLKERHFAIDSVRHGRSWFHFKPLRVSKRKLGEPEPFSALLLMDQSGSISSSDRQHFRLEAAKRFVSGLGNANEVALWRFPAYSIKRGGNRDFQPMVSLTTDTAHLFSEIETLSKAVGGGTPMFVAQQAAVAYLADSASRAIKALLTFTDGHSDRKHLADSVISLAQAHGIKLINIGLGMPDSETLLTQAMQTNGAYLYAKDAQQLISFYGNLDKLIGNNATYYHTRWELSGNGKLAKRRSNHSLNINFPFGGTIQVPFTLRF